MSCAGKCTPPAIDDATPGGEFPSAATNPCKLCTPLGACLAFKGIAGAVPLLHGSQGCATYIRRYMISHYREPIDIASSNFSEDSAVFGGRRNLHTALDNVTRQYRPALVGIATTCLAETMGENMPMLVGEYRNEPRDLPAGGAPAIVHVSTPSYKGTHADGFHATVRALVEQLVEPAAGPAASTAPLPLAVFSGMISPADLRQLREMAKLWETPVTLVPDYADTLDGASWAAYERMPAGGTTLEAMRALNRAPAAIEFGRVLAGAERTGGTVLAAKCGVPLHRLGLPIGLRETDAFCAAVEAIAGRARPAALELERGRLVDSYVDGHKYVSGKRAVVYGEEDLVVGLAAFLAEIGVTPVLCASGGRTGRLAEAVWAAAPELKDRCEVREGSDFGDIENRIRELAPDFLLGSSKGYKLARSLGVPLVRCGFPVHDRLGAQRIQVLGYAGTQQLYDRIVNALLEVKQEHSEIGYAYL